MNLELLLKKKRDGGELSKDEIEYFIQNLVHGKVAQCQIGAMLMAMYIRGINEIEAVHLTQAMILSGETLEWNPEWQGLLVDKHSTGGVGDKISLILAPVLAACGLKVPMISGRSLEHTGGTLDKLESIPGFTVDLTQEMMKKALEQAGCFIAAATKHLCPADKILYQVRDETSTVDSINLMISSIISKKVSSGTKFLVVDVKVGKGAFCKTIEMGKAVAKGMINMSSKLGLTTRVVLTRMDEPIGNTVGNALEVTETIQCLSGCMAPQIERLVTVLGSNLLEMTNRTDIKGAESIIKKVIQNGSAMNHFRSMLLIQGVNEETVYQLCKGDVILPTSPYRTQILARSSGWISEIDAMEIGRVCQYLGASRYAGSSVIDHSVGSVVHKHVGDKVVEGESWLTVHHSIPSLPAGTVQKLEETICITDKEVLRTDIIIEVLQ